MGQRTGLPVVHIDQLHWKPGWVARDRDEKIAMALAEQAKPEWIFEGGLSATFDHRFARADTVIFLDIPLPLRFRRVVWRTLRHYGRVRPDMQDGCPERFNWEFYKWIWDTRHTGRLKPLRMIAEAGPDKTAHHLTSLAQVRQYLATVTANPGF